MQRKLPMVKDRNASWVELDAWLIGIGTRGVNLGTS